MRLTRVLTGASKAVFYLTGLYGSGPKAKRWSRMTTAKGGEAKQSVLDQRVSERAARAVY